MDNETRIRQDSSGNILWKLFRIWVEETEVPFQIHQKLKETIGVEKNESK